MAESTEQTDLERKKFTPRCSKHDSDLLPVFCRDCNRLMCTDCVTTDHTGHNLCKVTEVAEFYQNKLEKNVRNTEFMGEVKKSLRRSREERNELANYTKDLLCSVSEREEEIMQSVKIWRQKMVKRITDLEERLDLTLKENEDLMNALIHFNKLSLEVENQNLPATYLQCEVERMDENVSKEYKLQIGPSGKDLETCFGHLDHEQESASDVISENNEKVVDSDEEDTFYESQDNLGNITRKCIYHPQCTDRPIDDIVVFHKRRIFILSDKKLFQCETNVDDFNLNPMVIMNDVNKIAQIPDTGDTLCIMNKSKLIKRLSSRNIITRYLFLPEESPEAFLALTSGGNQSYACMVLNCCSSTPFANETYLCMLNEYGVILKKYHLDSLNHPYRTCTCTCILMSALDSNMCALMGFKTVKWFDTKTKTMREKYCGSIGVTRVQIHSIRHD